MLDGRLDNVIDKTGTAPSAIPELSRRQTLREAADPAVSVAATGAPAAPPPSRVAIADDEGVTPDIRSASYHHAWRREGHDDGLGALVLGAYLRNLGHAVPRSTGMTVTITAPASGDQEAWGIGHQEGVPGWAPWLLASVTRSFGYITIVLVYTGQGFGPWEGVSLSHLWFASDAPTSEGNVTVTVNATYGTGVDSTRHDDAEIAAAVAPQAPTPPSAPSPVVSAPRQVYLS